MYFNISLIYCISNFLKAGTIYLASVHAKTPNVSMYDVFNQNKNEVYHVLNSGGLVLYHDFNVDRL